MRLLRRLVGLSLALAACGVIGAGPALAHECFNTSRSAQADASIAAHSHGWFDIQTWQILGIFLSTPCDPSSGQCPPPIPETAALSTVDPETLIGVLLGFAPLQALGSCEAQAAFANLVSFVKGAATIAEGNGVPSHYLTLSNATAAGGAPAKNTTNGKGIDHFPDVYGGQLFAAVGQESALFSPTPANCP